MELLQERIRREGRVLPGNIVKVDGFLNHRVDTRLLEDIADEFAKYFDTSKITVVLTAEASGIALATICAQKYGVPMLFAKKAKSDNIESGLYQSEVFSYTYKKRVTLLVSQEWLNADDHVLIIDDFMANGFAVQETLYKDYPTLMRPVTVRNSRYNQHMTTGSLLVEVGTAGNSLEEAVNAARLFAAGFAKTIQNGT